MTNKTVLTDLDRDTYRADFLDLALSCGAELTGKPDGTEPITILFSIEAWRQFDIATRRAQPEGEARCANCGEPRSHHSGTCDMMCRQGPIGQTFKPEGEAPAGQFQSNKEES